MNGDSGHDERGFRWWWTPVPGPLNGSSGA